MCIIIYFSPISSHKMCEASAEHILWHWNRCKLCWSLGTPKSDYVICARPLKLNLNRTNAFCCFLLETVACFILLKALLVYSTNLPSLKDIYNIPGKSVWRCLRFPRFYCWSLQFRFDFWKVQRLCDLQFSSWCSKLFSSANKIFYMNHIYTISRTGTHF